MKILRSLNYNLCDNIQNNTKFKKKVIFKNKSLSKTYNYICMVTKLLQLPILNIL